LKVETQFGTHVVQVTYKAPAVRKVQIATITYNVEPSAATEQVAYNSARDFLALAAGSSEKFSAAVEQTGASRRVATIGAADREVRGLADSRELVRWSFNSKPGTVSTIFEIDNNYVVVLMASAKETGFSRFEDVSAEIGNRLREDKKVEMLTAQLAGKSLAEVAAMTDATQGEFTGLRSSLSYEATIGYEPAVIGALPAVVAGVVSKPVRGYTGMYVLEVAAVNPTEEADEVGERVRLETAIRGTLPSSVMQALREGSDIVDNRAKFF
jgi:peptidyl-prolyl cis-trans isomerase D